MKISIGLLRNLSGLLLIFFASSCETAFQEESLDTSFEAKLTKSNSGEFIYYLDNVKVPEGTYKIDDEHLLNVTFQGSPKSPEDQNIHNYAFTSEELYLEFSDANNLGLERVLAFNKDAEAINERFSVVKYYDRYGSTPEGYDQAIKELHYTHFGKDGADAKGLTILYQDCPQGGNSTVMPQITPFMPPGWNNTVSRVDFVALVGAIVIYDRFFFRRYLTTCVRLGFENFCLPPGVNDRMSSGLTITIP